MGGPGSGPHPSAQGRSNNGDGPKMRAHFAKKDKAAYSAMSAMNDSASKSISAQHPSTISHGSTKSQHDHTKPSTPSFMMKPGQKFEGKRGGVGPNPKEGLSEHLRINK